MAINGGAHSSIEESGVNLGTMNCGMTSSAGTSTKPQAVGVVDGPDVDLHAGGSGLRHLGVAFEAEVVVPLHQHLGIDRSVRAMAGGAAFAHRLVFVDMHLSLLAMAGDTGLILARHGQAARGLHDIQSVGIMTLNAVHLPLGHGVMVGKVEFRLGLEMALVAGLGIVARVGDELSPSAARLDMQASRTVAGFAAMQRAFGILANLDLRMPAHGKTA